jgi:hypothetical protein
VGSFRVGASWRRGLGGRDGCVRIVPRRRPGHRVVPVLVSRRRVDRRHPLTLRRLGVNAELNVFQSLARVSARPVVRSINVIAGTAVRPTITSMGGAGRARPPKSAAPRERVARRRPSPAGWRARGAAAAVVPVIAQDATTASVSLMPQRRPVGPALARIADAVRDTPVVSVVPVMPGVPVVRVAPVVPAVRPVVAPITTPQPLRRSVRRTNGRRPTIVVHPTLAMPAARPAGRSATVPPGVGTAAATTVHPVAVHISGRPGRSTSAIANRRRRCCPLRARI